MRVTLQVAGNILREAFYRRWVLVLAGLVTLALVIIMCALRLDIVDGALAAVSLFGRTSTSTLMPVDVMMRPLVKALALFVYCSGIVLPTLVFAEFAPTLLSPGRVESLLALPLRRSQLLIGTFVGVWMLAAAMSLYASLGITIVIGAKSGIWTLSTIRATMMALIAWSAVYAFMLAAATFARSTAFCALVGVVVIASSVAAGMSGKLLHYFAPGFGRNAFLVVSRGFPRLVTIGKLSMRLAGSESIGDANILGLLAGCLAFTAAGLLLATWSFERNEY